MIVVVVADDAVGWEMRASGWNVGISVPGGQTGI
jgi:hypothetical protein